MILQINFIETVKGNVFKGKAPNIEKRQTERDRERERDRDRETERQRDRKKVRKKERKRDRERQRQTRTHIDIHFDSRCGVRGLHLLNKTVGEKNGWECSKRLTSHFPNFPV